MKIQRQTKILEIIENDNVTTQDEIQKKLNDNGFSVTQATVSRDIKELHIIKSLDKQGNYKYISGGKIETHKETNNIKAIIAHSIIDIQSANNLIVVKCKSGTANAACACIDELKIENVIGSIAGDDTILLITKDIDTAKDTADLLRKI